MALPYTTPSFWVGGIGRDAFLASAGHLVLYHFGKTSRSGGSCRLSRGAEAKGCTLHVMMSRSAEKLRKSACRGTCILRPRVLPLSRQYEVRSRVRDCCKIAQHKEDGVVDECGAEQPRRASFFFKLTFGRHISQLRITFISKCSRIRMRSETLHTNGSALFSHR